MCFGYFSENGFNEASHSEGAFINGQYCLYTLYVTLCAIIRRPGRPHSDRMFIFPSGDSSEQKYCGDHILLSSIHSISCFPINICSPCASWLQENYWSEKHIRKNKNIHISRKLLVSLWACGVYYRNMPQVLWFSRIQDLLVDDLTLAIIDHLSFSSSCFSNSL